MVGIEEKEKEEVKSIVAEHGGMISKEMANGILNSRKSNSNKTHVTDILEGKIGEGKIIDLEGYLYRIFNKIKSKNEKGERERRSVLMGNEIAILRITLWDKQAEMIDSLFAERGDKVLISNLRLKRSPYGYELSSTAATSFLRLIPSKNAISDFSELNAGSKNIDLVGRIASIGSIRVFKNLKGEEESVSYATITDGKKELKLLMWGTSSENISSMKINSKVKIEFASIKETATGLEISAGESSRMLIKEG